MGITPRSFRYCTYTGRTIAPHRQEAFVCLFKRVAHFRDILNTMRTLLSRILNHGTVKVHELSRAIEQWEERVRSYQSRVRERISDDVRSRSLTEMCLERIKTHIHINLTRLADFVAVRSEIETFLQEGQSSSNPDAMDIGQPSVPNVARMVREARVMIARDRARKASEAKGKLMMAKEKAKVASGKHARYLKGTCNHC